MLIYFNENKEAVLEDIMMPENAAKISMETWAIYSMGKLGEDYDIINNKFVKLRTEEQIIARKNAKEEIIQLKRDLADTDYKAIKFAEGELTEEEFAPVREQREQWRVRIRELEKEIN